MAANGSEPVIDFTSYIAEHTQNFTGRDWIFEAVDEWLANPAGPRFFLLRGEPGSGKTAISARLSQFAEGTVAPPHGLASLLPNFLSAFHFCSAQDSRWIHPRVFAESLALQLAERYPVYAKALAEKSGERSIRIEVQQRIEQGQGVGVLIKKLDVSGTTPEDAFDRVVREPLEALVAEESNRQVIILVDALDEALSSTITPTIVSLLSQTDKLPSRVRFILTSRLEMDVLRPLRRSHPKELTLTSGQGLTQSLQDVQLYTRFALDRNPELENKLAPGLSRQTLINSIQEKSEGNFLYVRYLLNMLLEQQEQITLTQLDALPTGLDGIYLEFLERLVKSDTQSWEYKYAPILGALAVAQIPLTDAQLSDLTGRTELSMMLKRLHQLLDLDETLPLSQRTYALYHRSFTDFLLDKDRSEEYGRDEQREHLHLAHWCEKDNLSIIWEDAKYSPGEQGRREYARKYYITHLYLSCEWQQPHKQRLFEVLDIVQYGQAKIHDDPSGRSYAQDVALGQQAAAWKGWTREQTIELLPRLWQYTLLRVSLTSRADRYPPVVFGLLVILKRKQEAIELAKLVTDPIRKISALVQIAGKLREQSDQETEWLGVLMEAREVASMIQGSYEQTQAYRELATALAQAQQWEQAEAIIDRIPERSSSEREKALRELAPALVQAQQWERAEAVIGRIPETHEQNEALRELATALAQAQQWERADVVISRILEGYSREQGMELSELALVLIRAQQWERAEAVIGKIRQGSALRELASALMQAQQWERAEAVIGRIPGILESPWGEDKREEALRELATTLIQAQQWERAEAVIGRMHGSYKQAEALRELAIALAQTQQWEQAEAMIDRIPESPWGEERAQALRELATALAQAQQWERAEAVIDRIPEDYSSEREKALRELAPALVQAQQRERAEAIWKKAEEARTAVKEAWTATAEIDWDTRREDWRDGKAERLRESAIGLIQAQQWDRAEAAIDDIGDLQIDAYSGVFEYSDVLSELATALAQAQQWERAEAAINRIWESPRCEDARARALGGLATALAQAQQWERAEAVIDDRIPESPRGKDERARALMKLATALAQAQQWEQAEAVINRIPEGYRGTRGEDERARALSELAQTLIQAQQWERAEALINRFPESYSYEREMKLSVLAQTLIQAQQWERAEALINRLPESYSHEREMELSVLAKTLIQVQQWEWAEAVIGKIQQGNALSELATALVQAQQWKWAEAVISRILEGHDSEREMELSVLATALIHAQQWKWAEAVIGRILEGHSSERADALSGLTTALIHAQQWKWADAIIGRSWSLSELKKLAWALEGAQQWERADAVISRIQDSDSRTEALSVLATALIHAQQWDRAEAIIGRIGLLSELKKLATALIQAQQWKGVEAVIVKIQRFNYGEGIIAKDALVRALLRSQQWERANALMGRSWPASELRELIQAQQWERAEAVIKKIPKTYNGEREIALNGLARALAQAQQWERAEAVIKKIPKGYSIEQEMEREETLRELAAAKVQAKHSERLEAVIGNHLPAGAIDRLALNVGAVGESEQLLQLLQHSWLFAKTRRDAFQNFSLAIRFISEYPELGRAFYQAYTWVETFLA